MERGAGEKEREGSGELYARESRTREDQWLVETEILYVLLLP